MISARWMITTALCAVLIAGIAGCAAVKGRPVPVPLPSSASETHASVEPQIRQTDSMGRPLPFVTLFPNRWSGNNDGTPYEPCTSLRSD